VFFISYMVSELRRRKGRTVLTALGLALGIGVVVTVGALSTGLDRAQAKVLAPLTGVGTDLSVTRPIKFGNNGPAGLSPNERKQLEKENGGTRIGLRGLGKPGTHFSRDDFISASQLSFSQSEVAKIRALSGVKSVAGALTLTSLHVEGTVPKQTGTFQGPGQGGPPNNIDATSKTITGIDRARPAIAPLTPGQIVSGGYLRAGDEAVLNVAYANRNNIKVGDTIKISGKTFKVVGLAQMPLGGQASDIYVDLTTLQKLSDRVGRVNTIQVRATSAKNVSAVAAEIKKSFSGASVTTAKDLADRVSGSLVDAKNLTNSLGLALEIVGLLAAFLIACLLTLGSVTKRVRELGTLKALGWPQRLVVRQVTGESLLQGLLGGVLGVALGIGGAAMITAISPSLKATVAQAATTGPRIIAFGQGSATTSGSTQVSLTAPVSVGLILLAVALAIAGGLLSGAVGGLRAARLRPAEALRHID
jgi:ABC-type antimicrobial peptide transport system permease subunit